MSDESEELLERSRAGESAALASLIVQHLPGLKAYVSRRAGQVILARESVDDLVQSACREVLGNLDQFNGGPDNRRGFANWLYWSAWRKILERKRFHSRQKRDVQKEVHVSSPVAEKAALQELYRTTGTPSRAAIEAEECEQLREEIEGLPSDCATVIKLAYFEGMSRDGIAQLLGRPNANAAQVLLSRALARLAVAMERRRRGGA